MEEELGEFRIGKSSRAGRVKGGEGLLGKEGGEGEEEGRVKGRSNFRAARRGKGRNWGKEGGEGEEEGEGEEGGEEDWDISGEKGEGGGGIRSKYCVIKGIWGVSEEKFTGSYGFIWLFNNIG